VAAVGDGTLRWYDLANRAEVMTFFPSQNRGDWIAWIPSGYYTSSLNGDRLIGWHVNRGAEQAADFYKAIQFERLLFRPDIVRAALASGGESHPPEADLLAIAPPRIRIEAPMVSGDEAEGDVLL